MLPILAVLLAIGAVVGPSAPRPMAVSVVPDEPGTVVLPDRPTIQAVVADLEGRGMRDLVRLVEDGTRGRVVAEVWRYAGGGWARLGEELEVIPGLLNGSRGGAVFGGPPVRLIVRREAERERVTIVRQPHFEPPGREPVCCLQFQDVIVSGSRVGLQAVGSDPEAVDSVHAIDLDGDGTDELLASRSLPPLGRTSYPSQALVFRWHGQSFGAATVTELPVGSGDVPFVLGDTDGRSGEEAAVITTAAQSRLYRLVLEEGDGVRAEQAGMVVRAALAVPLDDGPGLAVIGPVTGLSVHRWPAREGVGPAIAERPITRGTLLGPIGVGGRSAVLVEERPGAPITAHGLPNLAAIEDDAPQASAAAMAALAGGPLRPYRGALPGGGPDGRPAVVLDGSLLPWIGRDGSASDEPLPIVALGGARPIGLAGPERGWMALMHETGPGTPPQPSGGRMAAIPPATGVVSLAPFGLVAAPERDGGTWEPDVLDAVRLGDDGTLGISAGGFGIRVEAPPGSRLLAGVGDGSGALGLHQVPADGRLEIRLPLPRVLLPYGGDQAWIGLVTPAGATYTATVNVVALTGAPPLSATTRTSLGSTAVEVHGQTVPYAAVTVDGRAAAVDATGSFATPVDMPPWPTAVEVVVTDPVGNTARTTVSGVGLFDYRALPWIPITVVLLAASATALYVRAPRVSRAVPDSDDGAALEELDP